MPFPAFFSIQSRLPSIINPADGSHQQLILRPGQVLPGRVLQLLPQQMAWIQFGTFKIAAQLDVPLEVGRNEWFQVAQTGRPTILKLISPDAGISRNDQDSIQSLLRWFGVEDSTYNRQILNRFITEQLPLSRPLFQQTVNTLTQLGRGEAEQEAVFRAVRNGWPPSPAVVRSLLSLWHGPPLSQLISDLIKTLPLQQRGDWTLLSEQLPITQLDGLRIKHFIQQLSLQPSDMEGTLNTAKQDNLSGMIHSLLSHKTLDASIRERLENILYYLTGQQLMLQTESLQSSLAFNFFQLLIKQRDHTDTVYGELQGHIKKGGELDPEHGRLLLYVNLKHLKELCVDITIQKKWISIRLYNSIVSQQQLDQYKPILSTGLAKHGYQLSSLSAKDWTVINQPISKGGPAVTPAKSYQGVDIRI